jgi:hypothetical protein
VTGFQHDIAGGSGNLVVTSLQSPNFVSGSAGWQVAKNGNAEFNNVTVRGTFAGTNWIENASGSFYYSGTPAANLLIQSESNTQGQDGFGNYFLSGNTVYVPAGGGGYIAVQNSAGAVNFYFASVMVSVTNPWTGLGNIAPFNGTPNLLQITPGPNAGDYIGLAGPVKVTGGFHYSGQIVAYAPSTTTDETWHAMSLLNSWAAGSAPNVQPKYRLTAFNEVEVIGTIAGGSATAATFFTLPAGYRPASQQMIPAQSTAATAGNYFIQCGNSGSMSVQGPSITGTYVFHGFISLDA